MYSTVRSFLLVEETLEEKVREFAPAGPPSLPVFRTQTSYERRGEAPRPRRAARAGSDRTLEIHPRGEGRGGMRF